MEAFNKELEKLLFKPMSTQELQDAEKVLEIWVQNLNSIGNKMNNTKSSMIDMKPKDVVKLDTVKLDNKYPEAWRPKKPCHRLCLENTYRLDRIVQKPHNRVLYYLQFGPDKAFVKEGSIDIFSNQTL